MAGASLAGLPLRTRKLWADACKLERDAFYKQAILSYVEFLEHVVATAALSYYDIHNPMKTNSHRNKIFKLNDMKKSTLSGIKEMSPKKIWDSESNSRYKEVQYVRNTVSAHPYFAISFNKTPYDDRRLSDINNHTKLIRRLYNIVKNDRRSDEVEAFLKRYMFVGYSSHERESLDLEQALLKEICRKTRENVVAIWESLSSGIALSNPYVRALDKWMEAGK